MVDRNCYLLLAERFGWALAVACALACQAHAETLKLEFDKAAGAVRDREGVGTGFTDRLPLTSNPKEKDSRLLLDTGKKRVELTSSRTDFNGRVGIGDLSAPGVKLSSLGFTGHEDFSVRAVFRTIPKLETIDQVGIYVGVDAENLTRAGVIQFETPEYLAVHTTNGVDNNGRFFGRGIDVADGMEVIIRRTDGDWEFLIDGTPWQPNSTNAGDGREIDPDGENNSPNLDDAEDLYVGAFALNVLNDNTKTAVIDSFEVNVETESDRPRVDGRGRSSGDLKDIGN